MLRKITGSLARSPLFRPARLLWEKNRQQYSLSLSKIDKLQVGIYLILLDYSEGLFPPRHDNQEETFQNEEKQFERRAGITPEESAAFLRSNPFGLESNLPDHLEYYATILRKLIALGIKPGNSTLELGCGSGWMSEFLAASGCSATGTSINALEIESAICRIDVIRARGVKSSLEYQVARMETVDEQLGRRDFYDFVFVHAALHHAFDWKQAMSAVQKILKPGGWFLICNEPNLLHTFVSYRIAKMDRTHEIGMSRSSLSEALTKLGFVRIHPFANRAFSFHRPIWLAAQKPTDFHRDGATG